MDMDMIPEQRAKNGTDVFFFFVFIIIVLFSMGMIMCEKSHHAADENKKKVLSVVMASELGFIGRGDIILLSHSLN